jgi:hypothetical protein
VVFFIFTWFYCLLWKHYLASLIVKAMRVNRYDRLLKGLIFAVAIFFLSSVVSAQRITVQDELSHLSDPALLPVYRPGTNLYQVSSYDTTGWNDDGFSGKYSFIRRNPDSTLVIFDAKGPGVINRIWTPTPTKDTLDIYIDEQKYSVQFDDLFSGKVSPFNSPLCGREVGGNYCYYPILFQQHCRIIFRGKKLQFYQIQWRTFSQGTKVAAFNPSHNNSFRFLQAPATATLKKHDLAPGNTQIIFQQQGGGRLNSFMIYPASAFAGNVKDAKIRITWDDEKTPAVDCPVQDFFGFAFGQPSMQSYLFGTRNDTAYCYIPMPYDRNAKVELINLSAKRNISIFAAFTNTGKKRNAATEGKFYTSYNHQRYGMHDGPHELLNIDGKGHYIGTILQSQGISHGMTLFFEGDDSTVIDGKLALHGTGSEDYFNGGWYALTDRWDDKFSLPLHGSILYSIPLSRTGGYRLFLSDKMPFEKSLYHSIGHGPDNNNIPAIYTSLALYYGEHPVKSAPVTREQEIFSPDTLLVYPYMSNILPGSGINVKHLSRYHTGGQSTEYSAAHESFIRLSLEDIPEGKYELLLDYDELPAGAKVRLMQRQIPVTDWMDTYNSETKRIEMKNVGAIERTPFTRTITVHIKPENGKNQFFLSRLLLVRKKV